MTFGLEIRKLKRTGYVPAFLGSTVLAAVFPVLNMLVRSETFTALPGDPFFILTDANWQMMAMLNILSLICGACMMYHTEFADNGSQKMDVLPIHAGNMFLGKCAITVVSLTGMLWTEIAVLAGCALHWFPNYNINLWELIKNTGFSLMAALPTVMLMLLIASACRNMWISLGIGVILVFTFSIFPKDNLFLSLCPFCTPYQTLDEAMKKGLEWTFLWVCAGETVLLGLLELLYIKMRRCFS